MLVPPLLRVLLPDHVELIRLRKRKRLQDHRVHRREDRRVRADSERKRQNGCAGEGRRATHRTKRVPCVGHELLDRSCGVDVMMRFARLCETAELDERLAACLIPTQPEADVLLGFLLEMKLDLFVQCPLGCPREEQRADSSGEPLDCTHGRSSDGDPECTCAPGRRTIAR